MFRMTCDIKIGSFKPLKPNACSWSRHITNFTDSAKIQVPAISMLKTAGDSYEKVQTGMQFKEGMPVEILCGYNGRNTLRFKGFISRLNFTVPLEIECEGYSYQLRKVLNFTKSYKKTNVKRILLDLVKGTDIKLSDKIPEIPIEKVAFENASGISVLEWLKEKCLLTVYFNYDVLYVGLMQAEAKETVKFSLGWNVIKDNSLKFNDQKEFTDVRIELSGRSKDGTKPSATTGSKNAQVVRLKTVIQDKACLNELIKQKQLELVNRGYEGSIKAFLEPAFAPGMAVNIEDPKYPERTGKYFGTGVDGEFSSSGGRQNIKIGNSLSNG